MSDMSVKEAYKVMQANCGIEDNDEVKLLRMYEDYEMGCDLVKDDQRQMVVGHNYFAGGTSSGLSMRLRDKRGGTCVGFAPFFCLELAEKAKPKLPPIMVGSYEVEFHKDGIEVECVTVSLETLKEMVKRLEENN